MELPNVDKSFHGGRACPFLSVVLPVRNEEKHLGAVLEQLRLQDYPHDQFEIIVADGESTDGTRREVESFQKNCAIPVRLINNPKQLSSAGRNAGARAARGEYVFFIDGHCVISHSSMLRDAVALFERTGCDCLCRPQPLTLIGNSPFQQAVAHARASILGHGTDSTIYDTDFEGSVNPTSAGALYRRQVFSQVGYYDEAFDACEDVEFNYRVFKAGLKSWISPKLAVFYHPRANIRGLWKQMMRYGRGRCRFVCKHPDALSKGQLIPAVFVLWLILGAAAACLSKPILAIFLTTLAVYSTVVFAFSGWLAIRHGFAHVLYTPVIYLTIHIGLGLGFLAEAFSRAVFGTVSNPPDSESITSGMRAV